MDKIPCLVFGININQLFVPGGVQVTSVVPVSAAAPGQLCGNIVTGDRCGNIVTVPVAAVDTDRSRHSSAGSDSHHCHAR